MDPGNALAVTSLVIDIINDLFEYYSSWKDSSDDVETFRGTLIWLRSLFESLRKTLNNDSLNEMQVKIITDSVSSCETVISKLKQKLDKVKREMPPKTVLEKLDNQRRRFLYPFKKSTIIKFCELIDDLRDQIHVVATILDVDTTAQVLQISNKLNSNLKIVLENVTGLKGATNSSKQNENQIKVMEWLNPINQSTIHNDTHQKHEAGSGEWLFTNDSFQRRKAEEGSSLWLYGEYIKILIDVKGGCGKTTLFSSVVDRISSTITQPNSNTFFTVVYFYCLYRKGANHDLGPILRTYIVQICHPGVVPDPLWTLYDRHSSKFPLGIPSDDELKNCLLEILSTKDSGQVFMMIDALDELPPGRSRVAILRFFNELATRRLPNLHILATSRDVSDIMLGLSSFAQIPVDKLMIIEDIRMYVTNQLSQDARLSAQNPATRNKILTTLVDKSEGSFRWAALQLDELRILVPMRPRSIQKALTSLPRNLDETYERILNIIHPGNSEEALNALKWISFATRPLFVEELVEVCAINIHEKKEFNTDERYDPLDVLDILPGLLSISPPITRRGEIVSGTHVITFAHFSVLEYLLGDRIKSSSASFYSLKVQTSNHFIARSCIAYLKCCNTLSLRNESYPLREYCWDYWAWHTVYNSETRSPEGQELIKLTKEAQNLFQSISHSETQANFEDIKARLSYIATWLSMADPEESQFMQALQIPFFYPEFDVSESSKEELTRFQFPKLAKNSGIRLIELFPSARRFTEIRCRIFSVLLDSHPKYQALSYYWNYPCQVSKIRANSRLLDIPANLVADLQGLRRKKGTVRQILFVDALSFDHANDEEREFRVKLMPRIFFEAQQVAIGLGEKKEADADAIDFIRRVVSFSFHDEDLHIDTTEISQTRRDMSPENIGHALLQLFERPWWRRIWPVQELILPRNVTPYYGDTTITFSIFQEFFEMGMVIQKLIGPTAYSKLCSSKAWISAQRVSMIRSQYMLGHHLTLPELLWATQYHEAGDRLNKVYALIGLLRVNEQGSELLNPRLATTVEEKFTRVAVHILTKHRNFDLLSYTSYHPWHQESHQSQGFQLPSWVPNWASPGEDIVPLARGSFAPRNSVDRFQAGGHAENPPRLSKNMFTLTARGLSADILLAVHENILDTEPLQQLLILYKSIQKSADYSTSDQFWRTLLVDQLEGQELLATRTRFEVERFLYDGNEIYEQPNQLTFDLQYCKGRRLAITRNYQMCLVPSSAATGDLIIVIIGAAVPFLLRKTGENY